MSDAALERLVVRIGPLIRETVQASIVQSQGGMSTSTSPANTNEPAPSLMGMSNVVPQLNNVPVPQTFHNPLTTQSPYQVATFPMQTFIPTQQSSVVHQFPYPGTVPNNQFPNNTPTTAQTTPVWRALDGTPSRVHEILVRNNQSFQAHRPHTYCCFCLGTCASEACQVFQTFEERVLSLFWQELCVVCLKRVRGGHSCKGAKCQRCGSSHHLWLCTWYKQ